jgi:ferredoxin
MNEAARQMLDPLYIGDELTDETKASDKIEIIVENTTLIVDAKEEKSVLDILLNNGRNPPHSCKAGICMACTAVVETGTVRQDEAGSLSTKDIQERKILACQAIPVSKHLKVKFLG